jgi:XTP/dITP diphosphohydrolase
VIALLRGERLLGTFRGEAEGLIEDEPNGSGGFGYDPYFHFPELDATFAQTPPEVKWLHSHRGKAFRAMLGAILNDPPRSL